MDFLIIDDNKSFRDAACMVIESDGHYAQPAASGEAGLELLKETKFDAVLLDVKLDQECGLDILRQLAKDFVNLPVIMFTAESTLETAVEAMRLGALDFVQKPFAREQLHALMARLQNFNRMRKEVERVENEGPEIKSQHSDLLLDFTSPAMCEVMDVASRAAKSSATILITGESGTGKSVLAREIHDRSHLAGKPFVTVSCPSLSKELLESDLFGHVKGAFTGAIKDHWGKVKAANGGTLFLDEIGDLPIEIQPKLLRLLQEYEYERLGENLTRTANIRLIAATNRDLKARMTEGAFRQDLYFRLNVITLDMPPLRARNGDLLRFANHYVRHFAAETGRQIQSISPETLRRMESHSWPGNLRELRNAIQRAVILGRTNEIDLSDLPVDLQGPGPGNADISTRVGDLVSVEKLVDLHIRKVLDRTGNILESARVLGIDQATIYRRKKKLSQRHDQSAYLNAGPRQACPAAVGV
jgi:NtrC-family two-component system response regulator AlgB